MVRQTSVLFLSLAATQFNIQYFNVLSILYTHLLEGRFWMTVFLYFKLMSGLHCTFWFTMVIWQSRVDQTNVCPISVADSDPGSEIRHLGWKKSRARIRDPGSEMNIPDLLFENLVFVFGLKRHKVFDADQVPGSRILPPLDPGSGILSTLDPGSGIRDRKIGFGILDPGSTSRISNTVCN